MGIGLRNLKRNQSSMSPQKKIEPDPVYKEEVLAMRKTLGDMRARNREASKHLVNPDSRFMAFWDGCTTSALAYTALITPFEVRACASRTRTSRERAKKIERRASEAINGHARVRSRAVAAAIAGRVCHGRARGHLRHGLLYHRHLVYHQSHHRPNIHHRHLPAVFHHGARAPDTRHTEHA